jgi:predicted signal transduction protein with EAL and GGDEF domain
VAVFSGLTAGEAERGERTAELEPVLPELAKALQKLARPEPVTSAVVAELHFERAQAEPAFAGDNEAQSREQHLLARIDSALHDDAFRLHLQPSAPFDEEAEQLIVQALIQLPTPEHGVLESHEFQDTAERNGRMPAIDRWLIRALLVWMRRNRDCWADVDAVFSAKLSSGSVVRPDFRIYLERCLDMSGVRLDALRFEIDGRDAGVASPEFAALARSLAARGCEVFLDVAQDGSAHDSEHIDSYDFVGCDPPPAREACERA